MYEDEWRPGVAFRAACAGGRAGHAGAEPSCACGVHAGRAPADSLAHLVGRDRHDVVHRVLGQVALWGTVVECEHGWRGSLAYPVALYVPTRRADGSSVDAARLAQLLTVYGVPAVPASRPSAAR